MRLYLLRHGETEFSRQDRFCGRIDAPLTEGGRRMAEAFADAYRGVAWRAIVASTRARTFQTALPAAAAAGLPVLRDARLDEMFFGAWQGLSKDELARDDAERFQAWCRDPAAGPPGGEAPAAVAERALTAIADATARAGDGDLLLVSHKSVIRIVLCRLLGAELGRYRELFRCPVASLGVLDLAPAGTTCLRIDDVSHLPEDLRQPAAAPRPWEGTIQAA